MTYILGVNAFHGDASAALIKNGDLIAAAEEERFRRIKHWAGFPSESIRYCLQEAGIRLGDLDYIAVNSDPAAHVVAKLGFAVSGFGPAKMAVKKVFERANRKGVNELLAESFEGQHFSGETKKVEHHSAHLASCHLVSPFEKSVAVSIDGLGDFASAAWCYGDAADLIGENRIFFPHSLGIFYEALTHYLGFKHYGDEYKVMGLAPYGEPRFLNEMSDVVHLLPKGRFRLNLKYFLHHLGLGSYEWENGVPTSSDFFGPELEKLLGPARKPSDELTQKHMDIARSVQAMYEDAFFHLLNYLHGQYQCDNLTLAGGCAMNSVANGKVYRRTPFKNMYIQSAAGDAGGAIGSAYALASDLGLLDKNYHMSHAYWGPSFDNDYHQSMLEARGDDLQSAGCSVQRVEDEGELCSLTASAIGEGLVIGWFQGRMEWGPRALGNRSILGDPRRADMKDILNSKIKRRESFRPFAPSILRESVVEWFEEEDDVPFMMQVFQIKEDKRDQIPAVTHVDGSGRLQTVSVASNSRYHRLIKTFAGLTGVPILLNTSFNENEPVVCKPDEALDCFLRTNMDVLVLGDYFVKRS